MEPDDRSARVLASNAGFEIIEVGSRVWFFDRRTRGLGIAAAVSGGVAALTLINGALLTLMNLTGSSTSASLPWVAVLAAFGIMLVAGTICWATLKLRSQRVSCARAQLHPLAIVDRASGVVLGAERQVIAPVAQVRARRVMLISSSAPSIELRAPDGWHVEVFRGSMFGGGVEAVLSTLTQLGFAT